MLDLIIDGEYIKEQDFGNSLIGSSNQRVIPLTDRYKDKLYMYGKEQYRVNTINIVDNEIHVAGIPVKGIEAIIQVIKDITQDKEN